MKTIKATLLTASLLALGFSGIAQAKTEYHVYKKGSNCDISMKSPDKYGRGSSWQFVTKDTTRSGAKKKAKSAGCSSF